MRAVKTDIRDKKDIETFVNRFYSKVRENELLEPIFGSIISDNAWPQHLERMYDFWNAILFSETGFNGNPMQIHLQLPIEEKHFLKWLSLFGQTIDELFEGPKVDEAKRRADSIAKIMNFKISSIQTRY